MATVIVAPLPQYSLEGVSQPFEPVPGFRLCPLSPDLRARMCTAIPEGNDTDNLKSLVLQSDTAAIVDVPTPSLAGSSLVSAALYRGVADAVLRRVFDCLRLWADVPEGFEQWCWFVGDCGGDSMAPVTLKVLDTGWQGLMVSQMGFPLGHTIGKTESLWPMLCDFIGVAELVRTFRSTKKQKGYTTAGNERVRRESVRLAEIAVSESQTGGEPGPSRLYKIPKKLTAKWFIEGYIQAYLKTVQKLDQNLYAKPGGMRFARAFQTFVESFRIDDPFRYVARTTCLEALLGAKDTELSYQLSARAAWLLHAKSQEDRYRFFQEIKDCYSLRSTIVHGGKYSLTDLSRRGNQLLSVVRDVMQHILSCKPLRSVYLSPEPEKCEAFLKHLALGISAPE